LFTQYIVERGTATQKKELKHLFGNRKLTERDRPRIERLFEESGAVEHGCMLMETYFEEAQEAMVIARLSSKQAEPFLKLVEYIRERTR
jgi:geranylgeranyl pyrophosphate synthase